jgi:hypothetical protein
MVGLIVLGVIVAVIVVGFTLLMSPPSSWVGRDQDK